MTVKVSFHDDLWECEPIIVKPEKHIILKNDEFTLIEYVVKVATVRCYYNESGVAEK